MFLPTSSAPFPSPPPTAWESDTETSLLGFRPRRLSLQSVSRPLTKSPASSLRTACSILPFSLPKTCRNRAEQWQCGFARGRTGGGFCLVWKHIFTSSQSFIVLLLAPEEHTLDMNFSVGVTWEINLSPRHTRSGTVLKYVQADGEGGRPWKRGHSMGQAGAARSLRGERRCPWPGTGRAASAHLSHANPDLHRPGDTLVPSPTPSSCPPWLRASPGMRHKASKLWGGRGRFTSTHRKVCRCCRLDLPAEHPASALPAPLFPPHSMISVSLFIFTMQHIPFTWQLSIITSLKCPYASYS